MAWCSSIAITQIKQSFAQEYTYVYIWYDIEINLLRPRLI